MKYPIAFGALALVAAFAYALRADDAAPAGSLQLDTLDKRAGYALGYQLGQQLKPSEETVDGEALKHGLADGFNGVAPLMSESDLQKALMDFQTTIRAKTNKKRAEQAGKNKSDGLAFLEKNKTADGIQITGSGLQYKCVQAGNGQKPVATDTVTVNYEGKLIDGSTFDSSYARKQPASFPLSGVIKGWTEGLQLMDVGSTYMLYIPSELAYGEQGRPGIPPDSVLIFKVELISIKGK